MSDETVLEWKRDDTEGYWDAEDWCVWDSGQITHKFPRDCYYPFTFCETVDAAKSLAQRLQDVLVSRAPVPLDRTNDGTQTSMSLSEAEDWPISAAPWLRLRRVGWLDQKGRVYTSMPPQSDFDLGSLTPLLLQNREDRFAPLDRGLTRENDELRKKIERAIEALKRPLAAAINSNGNHPNMTGWLKEILAILSTPPVVQPEELK